MPDFVSHSDSENPELPVLAPAEDIPADVPADALPADEDATEDAPAAAEGNAPPAPPLTADRALNIAFGAALLITDAAKIAGQKLSEQAEFVQNNAPAVLDALEEKGKPVRQAVMDKIREAISFTPADDDSDGGGPSDSDLPNTSGGVDLSQELPRIAVSGTTVSSPVGGGSAEAEISALERRVRELEREVSKPLVVNTPDAEPQPQPMGETSSISETAADFSTYDFGDDAPNALADSPYAVSETPEEAVSEAAMESGEAPFGEPAPENSAAAGGTNGESNQV